MQRTNMLWRGLGATAVAAAFAACSPERSPTTGPIADVAVEPKANATTPGAPWDLIGNPNTATTQSTTINGGIWQFPVPFNVGTGLIQPFLSLSNQGNNTSQECFNTDATQVLDCTRSGGATSGFTTSLPLNQVPVIKVNNAFFREFILDANESNSLPSGQFSIDLADLYLCNVAAAKTWSSVSSFVTDPDVVNPACRRIYDTRENGQPLWAQATDAGTRGSGNSLDYRLLIPEEYFTPSGGSSISAASCPYNPTAGDCGLYLVLHTKMGFQGGNWATGSTFEEFSIIKRPWVTITKTAVPTFKRTYNWDITKTANPTAVTLWTGQSQSVGYTVTATRSQTDGDYAVSGNITVTNPSGQSVQVNKPTDNMGGLTVPVTCPGGEGPYTIAAGASLVCTYTQTLNNANSGSNTASVEIVDGAVSTVTVPFSFANVTPTIVGNASVDVTDQFDGGTAASIGTANGTQTFNYSRTLACGSEVGQRTVSNTARIPSENKSASADVTLTCVNLLVSKTATPTFSQTNSWEITKDVTPTTMNLYNGDTQVASYTVVATKTVTPSAYAVSGSITVANPSPIALQITSLSDQLTGDLNAVITGTGCAPTSANPTVIAANGSLVCQYSRELPNNDTRTNTARATGRTATNGITKEFSGTAEVNFAGVQPTVRGPASVTVTDAFKGGTPTTLGTASATGANTYTYTKTLACPADGGANGNVARIVETDQTASASVTVTCRQLTVTKTATTAYRRTFAWQIAKSRGLIGTAPAPASLILDGGQTFVYPFSVAVSTTGYVDDQFSASGTITIQAPSGAPTRTLNSLSDVISPNIAATVSCTGGNLPRTIASGASIECSYGPTALPDAAARVNTATVTMQNVAINAAGVASDAGTTNASGTAAVTFGAPTARVNACVNASDLGGIAGYASTNVDQPLGQVCVPAHPATTATRTFTYNANIGPLQLLGSCGQYQYNNTARIVETNQTSSLTTPITWECVAGCTLTQGYWKTHNMSFGVRNGVRKGPRSHDWSDAPAWTNWNTWRYFGGTPTPVPAGDPAITPVPLPAIGEVSWFSTFNTQPRGNAYYNAAHQFMAATLNRANGAGAPANVTAALYGAYNFFSNAANTPATTWTEAQRAQLIEWSGLFGSYNEGRIAGYPHCSEDATSQP